MILGLLGTLFSVVMFIILSPILIPIWLISTIFGGIRRLFRKADKAATRAKAKNEVYRELEIARKAAYGDYHN